MWYTGTFGSILIHAFGAMYQDNIVQHGRNIPDNILIEIKPERVRSRGVLPNLISSNRCGEFDSTLIPGPDRTKSILLRSVVPPISLF
jgi:hypothetical protein